MTRTLGILSGRDGTGKTAFSINLPLALRKFEKRVVLVDYEYHNTSHLFILMFKSQIYHK